MIYKHTVKNRLFKLWLRYYLRCLQDVAYWFKVYVLRGISFRAKGVLSLQISRHVIIQWTCSLLLVVRSMLYPPYREVVWQSLKSTAECLTQSIYYIAHCALIFLLYTLFLAEAMNVSCYPLVWALVVEHIFLCSWQISFLKYSFFPEVALYCFKCVHILTYIFVLTINYIYLLFDTHAYTDFKWYKGMSMKTSQGFV